MPQGTFTTLTGFGRATGSSAKFGVLSSGLFGLTDAKNTCDECCPCCSVPTVCVSWTGSTNTYLNSNFPDGYAEMSCTSLAGPASWFAINDVGGWEVQLIITQGYPFGVGGGAGFPWYFQVYVAAESQGGPYEYSDNPNTYCPFMGAYSGATGSGTFGRGLPTTFTITAGSCESSSSEDGIVEAAAAGEQRRTCGKCSRGR
jgi:hypothetical protein